MRLRRPGILCLLAFVAACGRGCWCTNAGQALTSQPPASAVREKIAEQVARSPSIGTSLCGVPVDTLEELTMQIEDQTIGVARVRVTGHPATHTDGGPKLRVDRALLCAGVLSVTMTPVLGPSGEATGWHASEAEIESVDTPGVTYDVEAHRHHHHHHH